MKTFVESFLEAYRSGAIEGVREPPAEMAEGDLALLYVTPGFVESRHLVALVLGSRGRPVAVVKTPRREWDDHGVLREAEILRELAEKAPGLAGSVPEVLSSTRWQGRSVLLETALIGQSITHARVRKDASAVDQVMAQLRALPDVGSADGESLRTTLLARAFARLRALAPPGHPLVEAAERTDQVLRALDGTVLPTPFEHGDPSHPNLLLLGDGRAGMVDWELARSGGAPGHDLVTFLTFVTFARRRAHGLEAERQALEAGLMAATSEEHERYVEGLLERGVAAGLATPLLLLSLARGAMRLLDRLDPEVTHTSSQAGSSTLSRFDDSSLGGPSRRLSVGELLRSLESSRNAGLWLHGVRLLT